MNYMDALLPHPYLPLTLFYRLSLRVKYRRRTCRRHRCSITYFVRLPLRCGYVADLDVAIRLSATHMPLELYLLASPA
jgi:hypothetical protein